MTLLWATNVIDRELRRQEQALRGEELDPATEIRQACKELDELFTTRGIRGTDDGRVCLVEHDGLDESGRRAEKPYERRWSLAFKHDH